MTAKKSVPAAANFALAIKIFYNIMFLWGRDSPAAPGAGPEKKPEKKLDFPSRICNIL